jgi:hypothetical protein
MFSPSRRDWRRNVKIPAQAKLEQGTLDFDLSRASLPEEADKIALGD